MTDEPKPEDQEPVPEAAAEETTSTPEEVTPEVEAPEASTLGFDAQTIADGKTFALLSYALSFIGIPFFILPLVMRDNAYSLYHAKQCLLLWIAGAISGVIITILSVICIGVLVAPILAIFLFVINIMGLIQTTKGEAKPLPLFGKYADDWFKGITVIEK